MNAKGLYEPLPDEYGRHSFNLFSLSASHFANNTEKGIAFFGGSLQVSTTYEDVLHERFENSFGAKLFYNRAKGQRFSLIFRAFDTDSFSSGKLLNQYSHQCFYQLFKNAMPLSLRQA
jgi:hypothetical protein